MLKGLEFEFAKKKPYRTKVFLSFVVDLCMYSVGLSICWSPRTYQNIYSGAVSFRIKMDGPKIFTMINSINLILIRFY